jgi:hypothetical protein
MTNTARLSKKRNQIRNYLRSYSVLPSYGSSVTKEQQEILNQIQNNNFEFYENFVKEKEATRIASITNNNFIYDNTKKYSNLPLSEEEILLKRKREKCRKYLRVHSVLPPYGDPMNEEQQKIFNQIENNDFSFHENYVNNKRKQIRNGHSSSNEDGTPTSAEPKYVINRLRRLNLMPPVGSELSEIQKEIINDVYLNWKNKNRNYFIVKYLHLTSPEGRLLYRTYNTSQKDGFNYNLTIDDIIIPEYCPYLNIKLSTDPKDHKEPNYATVDRIESCKGYVKGNVQVISRKANMMKSLASQEQILQFSINALKLIENIK